MSLVGTRPPTLDEWEKYEPHHRARMSFRPGLTGLWQVSGRSNITDFEEVVKLDTKYIGEAWKYVPFLLVSSVLNCASGLLGPILSAKKNSKAMMWSAIVGAVANIIMNIVFVNLTGIQGATFATLVSSYIIYIIRKYAVGEDIYINNYYVIIVTWLILVVQGIIESNFMNYYLEILCVVVIIIINKNSVWQVLNLVKNIYKNIK